jgi:hypothetical protein
MVDLVRQSTRTYFSKDDNQLEIASLKAFEFLSLIKPTRCTSLFNLFWINPLTSNDL